MSSELTAIHEKLTAIHGDVQKLVGQYEERCKHVDGELSDHEERVTQLERSEAGTKRITGLISAVVAAFVTAVGFMAKGLGIGDAQ